MMKNWVHTLEGFAKGRTKIVGYLSAEFLLGPHLGNAMLCLVITEQVKHTVESLGLNLQALMALEEEPGLGNGALGRLAACYLDSLSTLGAPGVGYGIRYEYGIFEKKIENGPTIMQRTASIFIVPPTFLSKFQQQEKKHPAQLI